MIRVLQNAKSPYQFVLESATATELSNSFDLDSVSISSFGLLGDRTMKAFKPFLRKYIQDISKFCENDFRFLLIAIFIT